MDSFTFLVLTYNHEKYILEHLQSMKFQIENFGNGLKFNLLISDDSSSDNTVELVKFWLITNRYLFEKITLNVQPQNIGTCKSLSDSLEKTDSKFCKITAGDDVYSFENLIQEFIKVTDFHIVSGLPLNLIDKKILIPKFTIFNIFATNIIYEKMSFLSRLKQICFFNAPSIIYSMKELKDNNIMSFVNRFFVTEDFPLLIAIAEKYNSVKILQINKIFIYYRRTAGSTYIVKRTKFDTDKINIFNYLKNSEKSFLKRILIEIRSKCHLNTNRVLKRLLNFNLYIYLIRVLFSIRRILNEYKAFNIQTLSTTHQKHYDLISSQAQEVLNEFNKQTTH